MPSLCGSNLLRDRLPARTPGLVAVVPAFQEEVTLGAVIDAALPYVEVLIVVDDGSIDRTAEIAQARPVHLIRHPENRGKGASLVSGLTRALQDGADRVITLDGDGQHDPREIQSLVAASDRSPDDVVIAARLRDREVVPRLRRFANQQANFWISWAAGQPISDTQSGFRLFPRQVLEEILPRCARHPRFVFESAILIEAARAGCRIAAVRSRAIYHTDGRRSHYRPAADTLPIIEMVAVDLLRRGMAPLDLARSLGLWPLRRMNSAEAERAQLIRARADR